MLKWMTIWILAGASVLTVGCNTTPAQDGAVLGGALGAGLGAVVGHQSGHQGEGALIGAGLGALTGALVGDQVGQNRQQRHYRAPEAASPPPAQPAQGRYENRVVYGPNGERYEQRVWVPYY